MTRARLLIHPAIPDWAPADPATIADHLGRLGFIADPFEHAGRTHYTVGAGFLDLITLLGCSPNIRLEALPDSAAPDPETFVNVTLSGPSPGPRFAYGDNTTPPRCPDCGHREPAWLAMMEGWAQDPEARGWRCPACGSQSSPDRLGWRQSAGLARYLIEVWGIYPAEGVPGEGLLGDLEARTGVQWDFFYALNPRFLGG